MEDIDFNNWLADVDAIFIKKTGLDRESFPDNCYWDMFEDGCSPQEAWESTIENEGYDPEDF